MQIILHTMPQDVVYVAKTTILTYSDIYIIPKLTWVVHFILIPQLLKYVSVILPL